LPTRTQIEELLKSDPADPFLQYALAMALVSEGRLDAALAQFEAVLANDPAHVASYFQMAQALAAAGRLDESRCRADQGIEAARRAGDRHAAEEIAAFRDSLG
jgi:predicted Zn-dependent protease